jgi:hypothetical protein
MNSTIQRRTLTATALLAVLLGSAACGSETVTDGGTGTQPGYEARVYPPASVPPAPLGEKKGPVSADAAERQAAAEKARQDRASTDRWARGTQIESNENKLKYAGHPGRQ